ncbi:hydrogenase iron-sulfur subunit [Halodesulfovibrio marinisediminis]|uniref:Putative adenylylsulfate reductase-associated electron transfer protein QmoB n=1 Tax=Halodesulfovibrio marinisediminis DSM 17456 TaxID=1121457 RepID=A0A1N6HFJ0_9BACT|nr:hydrogenase iron-sulfur subunit [Halodesulfovibrio marinisediminis]SIO18487.1 putative adenylylsulfate reductase-associated electron transfer protein QmoB [Halodesulfovibrio marinisediminis DSM 17456]
MAERIGVYFDQSALGIIDAEELSTGVSNKFGGTCPVVKVFPVLAVSSAREEIKKDIVEHELDGIVICGSSPRVDWDIYEFENVIVERVNLREQCAMAYKNPDGTIPAAGGTAPELLMAMAKDYVTMGIIKLQKTAVPEPPEFETVKTILVLGGGWAGLTAAKQAADYGYDVILVEKEAQLGGKALNMLKTVPLEYPYEEAHDTGLEAKIEEVTSNANIKVVLNATVEKLAGTPGQYTAEVAGQEYSVGAVVLAAGWKPMDEELLAPFGYGSMTNVVTSAEYEKLAKEGKIDAKRVAFIVNTEAVTGGDIYAAPEEVEAEEAASEEKEEGYVHEDLESVRHLAYSSYVNSMIALKQANYLCDAHEDARAYVLYDSMVVPGIHERYYKAAQDRLGIMMSKAEIKGITEEDGSLVVSAGNTLMGEDVEIPVDMVVLPTGIVPTTAKDPVMNFDYRQGPAFPDLDLFDGFADSNYICFPYETRRTGVYAAGCVRQPMMMDAAEEDAIGATMKAIQCIESANRGVAVHPRSGDLSYPVFNFVRCTQCKRCTEECPFGALDDDEKGTPLPNFSRCRRCGTCMGACPERVISFDNYNIDQIGSMIREIDVPDDMEVGGPRVLILACENDAYPALDMAAIRGKSWSPYVRIIPVRCLGSVNAIWVADAMSKGIDGVMLLGCKYGDDYQCHFVKGSEICNRRKDNIAETLERLGVEPDRVEQFEVAIDEYDKVPGMIDSFMDMVFEKGPNPFKGY